MKKVNLLILGNSSFVQRRVISSLNKIREIEYKICSKSQKNKDIFFNDYIEALKSKPDIVYISLVIGITKTDVHIENLYKFI